jgi:hypothetical protein
VSRPERPRPDKDTVSAAFNKHYGQVLSLFELLEAGLPAEHAAKARNVRLMVLDSLHQMRTSVDEHFSKRENY